MRICRRGTRRRQVDLHGSSSDVVGTLLGQTGIVAGSLSPTMMRRPSKLKLRYLQRLTIRVRDGRRSRCVCYNASDPVGIFKAENARGRPVGSRVVLVP